MITTYKNSKYKLNWNLESIKETGINVKLQVPNAILYKMSVGFASRICKLNGKENLKLWL